MSVVLLAVLLQLCSPGRLGICGWPDVLMLRLLTDELSRSCLGVRLAGIALDRAGDGGWDMPDECD